MAEERRGEERRRKCEDEEWAHVCENGMTSCCSGWMVREESEMLVNMITVYMSCRPVASHTSTLPQECTGRFEGT